NAGWTFGTSRAAQATKTKVRPRDHGQLGRQANRPLRGRLTGNKECVSPIRDSTSGVGRLEILGSGVGRHTKGRKERKDQSGE
ncbi:hypothetical protein LEMLEM_LOCUS21897, partial [Lemmus lemmus]